MDANDPNKPHKQRFKGVENFLRRVAFNLGNSPSQTEVKIISCVPIDVTDLQHRIQHLERQLQEVSKKKKLPKPPRPPPTPPSQTPPPMWPSPMMQPPMMWPSPMMQPTMMTPMWAPQPMSPLSTQPPLSIAGGQMGLSTEQGLMGQPGQASQLGLAGQQGLAGQGGQPGQAEQGQSGQTGQQGQCGKLPPCLMPPGPCIFTGGESQLVPECTFTGQCVWNPPKSDSGATGDKKETVGKNDSKSKKGDAIVHTALIGESYSGQSMAYEYSSDKSSNFRSHQKPTYSGYSTSKQARKSNVSFVLPAITTNNEQAYSNFSSHDNVNLDKIDFAADDLPVSKRRKKKRAAKKNSKLKTQLVYFSQHKHNNPFSKSNKNPCQASKTDTISMSHAYLDKVIRKQYDPKFVVQEFSDTSHFSQPICRDIGDKSKPPHTSDSDVCSCCHGRFQNVDNYIPKGFDSLDNITKYKENFSNKLYYDSNLYDMVPVKENTNKYLNLKERFILKRNFTKEDKCNPDQFKNKYEHSPKTVNFPAEKGLTRQDNLTLQKVKRNKMLQKYDAEQRLMNKNNQVIKKESKNICSIDCGDIYRNKPLPITKSNKTAEPIKTILLKNELIETDNLTAKLLCSNQSTQLASISDESKMESTLNQIKSILQSVLAEVKTNPVLTATCERMPTKDAIVQKGFSQNNLQGRSALLHSYTYNHSYKENPFLPSCSRQICAAQYYLPGIPYQHPLKYLQNFPVIVHPSGRRLCDCYYKNSSHKYSKYKEATAATTNTNKEIEGSGNIETKKLIKEIYKSVAMTMDFPNRDNSTSEYDDTNSVKNDLIYENNKKELRDAGIDLVNKKNIEVEASISSNVSNNNEVLYTATGTQLGEKVRYGNFTRNEQTYDRVSHRYEQRSTETIVEDDDENETSSDHAEDVTEFETLPKYEKKSLLKRMFKSVFKRSKGSKSQNECTEVSETSDSDEYETIYSGRTAVLSPKDRQTYKHKSRSKANLPDQNTFSKSHDKRRSPYLEQEYRREWNEQLIFDKQERKQTKRPYTNQSVARPAYWNSYEASARADPNLSSQHKPVTFRINGNKKK